jgi:N-acetylglucosaminyl-diphospho-decaprenol L-rhamnosyltransferase
VKIAVVTAAKGRTTHLRNQMEGLSRSAIQVDRHVLVAIDDDDVSRTVRQGDRRTEVIPLRSTTSRIPMAAARNLGAQAAIDGGADLLIFLDVDCIPLPDMVGRYAHAAERGGAALLCGPVTYLEAPGPDGYDLTHLSEKIDPHPARPAPDDGEVLDCTQYELFWSLSFAVTPSGWHRIGGFCTEYAGYGGEDTDFGQKAATESIPMRWVGGAHALHQFHPVSDPPIEHLDDIIANAGVFQRRWGWWPMQGWLDAFEAQELITRDRSGRPRRIRVRS